MQLQAIQNKIYDIRGQKVMLDRDLAELYGVTTGNLNKAVKRNIERFEDEDFMFELTNEEYNSLLDSMRFQNGIASHAKRPKVFLPYAFTEQGVAMLSGVLHSKIAIQVNRAIMRAFVTLHNKQACNSGVLSELLQRLSDEVADLKAQQDALENKVDRRHEAVVCRLNRVERRSGCWRSRPQPKHLSYEIKIRDYSRKAVVIFTENTEDARLLLAIGARHNSWLSWQGERVKGWVFPKSRFDEILQLLPEDWFMKTPDRHEN